MHKGDYLLHLHEEMSGQVKYADTKAVIITAVVGGLLVSLGDRIHAIASSPQTGSIIFLAAIAGALLLSAAIVFSLQAVFPRTSPAGSPVSWVKIHRRTSTEWATWWSDSDATAIDHAIVQHTHELAQLAQVKYKHVCRALSLGLAGLVPTLYALWATSPVK